MSRTTHARITKGVVDRLGKGQIVRDTDLIGFGVRRQNGAPCYYLQKRIGRSFRWITIGAHGAPWTPETARKEAYRLLGQIAGGEEPRLKRKDLTDKPMLNEVAERFLAEYGVSLKPASYEKYRFLLDRYIIPELGDCLIERIERADILRLHTGMAKRKSLANYAVAVLSKLMSWAEEHNLRPPQSNPCFHLKKYRENKRQRYLSTEEFARLGAVLDRVQQLDTENFYITAAIRLLLLTGARVGEIINLQWRHVDLERHLLLLPDSKTGQKVIRLNARAAAILREIPRMPGNPHVIIGRRPGASLVNLQKPWRRIRAEADLGDVRLHDLRHSFASVAAASKGSLPMIGKLLGHSHTRTTARYAHLSDDPVDGLNNSVGDTIAAAIGMASNRKE